MWSECLQIEIIEEFAEAQRYWHDDSGYEWQAWHAAREREHKREHERWRRKSDKEYRQAHNKSSEIARQKRLATDPQYREAYRAKARARMAAYLLRIRQDPEKLAEFKAKRKARRNGME